MSIRLTPNQERIIADKLQSGKYHSTEEILDAALRLLEENDSINTQVVKASDQMAFAGSWSELSEEIYSDIVNEIYDRRQQAFFERRDREASFD